MADIQLKITLNQGRHGILLHKLASIAREADKFLSSFSEDLNLNKDDWVADKFRNGSVMFILNYVGEASEAQIFQANKSLSKLIDPKTKIDSLNGALSPSTYLQFAKIAHPIDADDSIGLAVCNDKGRFITKQLTKERAQAIERKLMDKSEEFIGFQGIITAIFFRDSTCWIIDHLTNNRIVSRFQPGQYNKIWKLMENQSRLVDVEGWLTMKNGELRLKIESITASPTYMDGDLDKFIGSDPLFTGGKPTDIYLEELRSK